MKSEFKTENNLRKFKANMAEKGLQIDEIIPGGKIHRFQVVNGSGKPARDGWYVYFADCCPSGASGNERRKPNGFEIMGLCANWRHDGGGV